MLHGVLVCVCRQTTQINIRFRIEGDTYFDANLENTTESVLLIAIGVVSFALQNYRTILGMEVTTGV